MSMNLTDTMNVIKKVFEFNTSNIILINTKLGVGTLNELKRLKEDYIVFATNQIDDDRIKTYIKDNSNHDLIIFDEFNKASISTIDDVFFEICQGNLVGKNVILKIDDSVNSEYRYLGLDQVITNKLMLFSIE